MTPSPLRPESVLSRLQEMERLLEVLEGQRSVTGDDLRADLRERLVAERALQQVAAWLDDQVGDASGRGS